MPAPASFHGMDVALLFGPRSVALAPERALGEAMRAAWTAFARSGDPGAVDGTVWPRYDAARGASSCAAADRPSSTTIAAVLRLLGRVRTALIAPPPMTPARPAARDSAARLARRYRFVFLTLPNYSMIALASAVEPCAWPTA